MDTGAVSGHDVAAGTDEDRPFAPQDDSGDERPDPNREAVR